MKKRGDFLGFFVGNMACGKTRRLLLEIETRQHYGNKRIIAFKPSTDSRSGDGKLLSRKGDHGVAFEIPAEQPDELFRILREKEREAEIPFEIVAFDEVQFFSRDSGLFRIVERLLHEGYDILAAGLTLDFRGEPFGSTPDLMLLAGDKVIWLQSYCTACGNEAPFPQRFINGAPAAYDSPQILVGGDETYQPRCHNHFALPGRPHFN